MITAFSITNGAIITRSLSQNVKQFTRWSRTPSEQFVVSLFSSFQRRCKPVVKTTITNSMQCPVPTLYFMQKAFQHFYCQIHNYDCCLHSICGYFIFLGVIGCWGHISSPHIKSCFIRAVKEPSTAQTIIGLTCETSTQRFHSFHNNKIAVRLKLAVVCYPTLASMVVHLLFAWGLFKLTRTFKLFWFTILGCHSELVKNGYRS